MKGDNNMDLIRKYIFEMLDMTAGRLRCVI